MFHVPVEKHGVNGRLRQKGKISELALGYGGSIGALQAMGSREMNIPDEELKPLVDGWRKANPRIVQFWRSVGDAAMKAVRERTTVRAGKVTFCCKDGVLFAKLPSGRTLAYIAPRLETGRFGSAVITYQSYDKTEKAADEEEEAPVTRRWQREETYPGQNCREPYAGNRPRPFVRGDDESGSRRIPHLYAYPRRVRY